MRLKSGKYPTPWRKWFAILKTYVGEDEQGDVFIPLELYEFRWLNAETIERRRIERSPSFVAAQISMSED